MNTQLINNKIRLFISFPIVIITIYTEFRFDVHVKSSLMELEISRAATSSLTFFCNTKVLRHVLKPAS